MWIDCLYLPDVSNFVIEANNMIECATWTNWRESFMVGIGKAGLAAGAIFILCTFVYLQFVRNEEE